MASKQDQLDALRNLAWLYAQAKLWGAPRRFEYVGAHVEEGDEERRQLAREIFHAHMAVMQSIDRARKRLLATGYPVPDDWLTVRPVGEITSRQTAAAKGRPETAVLADSGADLEALEAVSRQMGAAILRLEAQLESGPDSDAGEASAAQGSAQRGDVPLTLVEFMATQCVLSDELTLARLDDVKKSLQNTARRKASGVTLPRHVGSWKPGRKKYYLPSQLRALWPKLVKRLPYLPPLKAPKP